ncbi:MAG TPA: hypothetical protein VGM67_10390 [Gemmatimonadaceae bacterium]
MTTSAKAAGRRFAWTLACAFAALAAIGYWRGRVHSAEVFAVVAAVMLFAGAIIPTQLGPLKRAWRRFGEALSRITSPIFFAILYVIVLTPMGMLRRTLARSPLARTRSAQTFWVRRAVVSREDARRSLEHLF